MSEKYDITSAQRLLKEVSALDLYPQLLAQLQKDINRAGIEFGIHPEITPTGLIETLRDLLFDRIQNSFNEYLNLLYAVDVSEVEMRNFVSEKVDDIANYATYLILKREWKKVWFRYKN